MWVALCFVVRKSIYWFAFKWWCWWRGARLKEGDLLYVVCGCWAERGWLLWGYQAE